jgi:DNA polymerase III subunit epsilon
LRYCLIGIKTIGRSSTRLKITELCLVYCDHSHFEVVMHESIHVDSVVFADLNRPTAKPFYEIAKSLVELTQDKILVAEDVYHEYTLLKKEFASLGYNFTSKALSLAAFKESKKSSYQHDMITKMRGMHENLCFLIKLYGEKELVALSKRKLPAPAKFDTSSLENIPNGPGVYFFKDRFENTIYIGKAKCLDQRIPHHLGFTPNRSKHLEFKSSIVKVEYVLCDSELEAILLEVYLIKKNQPVFNRTLKAKRFDYGIFYCQKTSTFTCRRYIEGELPLRTARSKRSALKLISFYERMQLGPLDLDFASDEVYFELARDSKVEIHEKRWMHWKHSAPLDLLKYPEIKWELIKAIKLKTQGSF